MRLASADQILPDSIILKIFQFFKIMECQTFACVNKHMQKIANNPVLYQSSFSHFILFYFIFIFIFW